MTVSMGVAQWTEPLTAGELLDRADRALLSPSGAGGSAWSPSARAELELAEIEGGQAPSEFMNDSGTWWRPVRSRASAVVLPAFLRPRLGLEEVALYDRRATPWCPLEVLSHARCRATRRTAFGAGRAGGGEVMRRVG